MNEPGYRGLLVIGDPHLEGRVPGYRKDDYPEVVLGKFAWCLERASSEHLLPVVLGDVFHIPRDNPNWLLSRLMDLMQGEIIGIYGNHDCRVNELTEDDSLMVLARAGRIRLLDTDSPWQGRMNDRDVMIGGTPWGKMLPNAVPSATSGDRLVIWLTHHNVQVPGFEKQGYFKPRVIDGIDLVINGHIHRHLESVQKGPTLWLTPGNIVRRVRGDATREHVPSVLQVEVSATGFTHTRITVPHQPFDSVFHKELVEDDTGEVGSRFIVGLKQLQTIRTSSGTGLMDFLKQNIGQFASPVQNRIMALAEEVTRHGAQSNP